MLEGVADQERACRGRPPRPATASVTRDRNGTPKDRTASMRNGATATPMHRSGSDAATNGSHAAGRTHSVRPQVASAVPANVQLQLTRIAVVGHRFDSEPRAAV